MLGVNKSDHVHYYQGGRPFKYILFHPNNNDNKKGVEGGEEQGGQLEEVILGPELDKGHKLQVCVEGGTWKCGHICNSDGEDLNDKNDNDDGHEYEYAIIGEAVAPGFDHYDFAWVKEEDIRTKCKGREDLIEKFMRFVHESARTVLVKEEDKKFDFAEYYDKNDVQRNRFEERS